jgi:hypothetical protein
MTRLLRELDEESRRTLLGTAIVIFVFRAMPGPGAGSTWWMIDVAGLRPVLPGAALADRQRADAVRPVPLPPLHGRAFDRLHRRLPDLTGTLLSLPTLGMYYGLHEWTAAHTGGVVDARFIALIDTALESPLGQIAMVPMLAWIANSAPANLKATYFAVMASFTNLALSASQLGTKYLNQIFEVSREVRDPLTNASRYRQITANWVRCSWSRSRWA